MENNEINILRIINTIKCIQVSKVFRFCIIKKYQKLFVKNYVIYNRISTTFALTALIKNECAGFPLYFF